MEIQNIKLERKHLGLFVTYIPNHAKGNPAHTDAERGIISTINNLGVWVRFKSPNGQKCNPDNLVWGYKYG